MKNIKWGIFSTGNIAHNFANTVNALNGEVDLFGVASRNIDKAQEFADEHGIKKAYASYEELAKDPEIDVVYIATPHNFHYENMVLCLENGKHILCEKSFTVTAKEAEEIYNLAKEKNLFVMEGFWTKFIPIYREIEKVIKDGVIGDIRLVTAQYGFCIDNPTRLARKFDPNLAGGALLDIGVYNIGFASMILGYEPKNIESFAKINDVGTDEYSSIILQYENGAIAELATAIQTTMPVLACIYGSKGYINIPEYKNPTMAEIVLNDGTSYKIEKEFEVNGFEYEIREAQSCIRDNKISSEVFTPEQSIAVMSIMDRVRELWGMKFPFED